MKSPTPEDSHHVQIESEHQKGLVVSVEAVKKPNGANKVQELAAMEEALKQATKQAHD